MRFLLRVLSPSYFRHHPGKTILAVIGIAVGVATFVSVKTAQQALGASFRASVGRLAGHADLQITGIGGVPELQEALRASAVVDASQPVIEQVVQPEDPRLGGLLVIGVDLVGDQRIRDYGFDAGDAEVDDPLVFLAKPDSVALSREFALRAGLRQGDSLQIRLAETIHPLTVRALLPPQEFTRAYGGNVAVMDVFAAQELFGRGRHFDRIEIRLRPHTSVDAGIAEIIDAIGPGFRVEAPDRRGAELQRLADAVVNGFGIITVLALGIGLFLVFNVFAIAVQRRRRDIGILRAVGATPSQVGALFLCEAALLGVAGGLLGAALGNALAGRTFRLMGAALDASLGMAGGGSAVPTLGVIGQGLAVGLLASLVGAWLPSRRAALVQPVEAMANGIFATTPGQASPRRALAGLVVLLMAYALGRFSLLPERYLLPVVALGAVLGTIVFAGRAARVFVRPVLPVLAWLAPASGRVAADALRQPRRTMATSAALTVSAAFVLGVAGYLQAARASFDGWIANVVTADLVVRASSSWRPAAMKLPYDLRTRLLQTPGVRSADAVRSDAVEYRGQAVTLVTVEGRRFGERTHPEFVAGDLRAFQLRLPVERQCVVSDDFARRFALGLGDVVTLESPAGAVRLPVAAVVAADRSTITIDRSLFVELWASDRVDAFYVTLEPGASSEQVREALGPRLAGATPALVSTREEFVEEMRRALGLVYVVIRAAVLVALAVALLGIAVSQLVVVAERSRDIGILRALGAVPSQIGAAVILEAVTLAVVSLAIALPLGDLLAWLLRAHVSETLVGRSFSRAYPLDTMWALLLGLPVAGIVATWIPARWAARLSVTETISYE